MSVTTQTFMSRLAVSTAASSRTPPITASPCKQTRAMWLWHTHTQLNDPNKLPQSGITTAWPRGAEVCGMRSKRLYRPIHSARTSQAASPPLPRLLWRLQRLWCLKEHLKDAKWMRSFEVNTTHGGLFQKRLLGLAEHSFSSYSCVPFVSFLCFICWKTGYKEGKM